MTKYTRHARKVHSMLLRHRGARVAQQAQDIFLNDAVSFADEYAGALVVYQAIFAVGTGQVNRLANFDTGVGGGVGAAGTAIAVHIKNIHAHAVDDDGGAELAVDHLATRVWTHLARFQKEMIDFAFDFDGAAVQRHMPTAALDGRILRAHRDVILAIMRVDVEGLRFLWTQGAQAR